MRYREKPRLFDVKTATGRVKVALTDVKELLLALNLGGKRAKKNDYRILCPWHAENTPSCHVWVDNGVIRVHCFGCGESTDVIGLIQKVEDLSFMAALRRAQELAQSEFLADLLSSNSTSRAMLDFIARSTTHINTHLR